MELEFELGYRTTVNLAVQQSAVPLVHSLEVRNPTAEPIADLQLSLEIDGGLLRPFTTGIATLPPGGVWKAATPDLRLSPEALVTVSERYRSSVILKVLHHGHLIQERSWPIDVLAYNEWTGVDSLPELLAAFCLPNHPAVSRVLKSARELLQNWSGDPSLDGYQTKSNQRVALTAAAIYGALQNTGVTYLGLPASFEVGGQKIRTPDQLLEQQMGNCLDITCTVAAALEQAGLHALLIITDGHAFPGVWLNEESCSGTFIDDPALLRKSAELGILALFDSSTLCAVPRQPFEVASRVALEHLKNLRWACDLSACRRAGIRPLPIRLASDGKVSLLVEAGEETTAAPHLTVPREAPVRREARTEREPWQTRLERWKNRLLDLTLRNKLLNFREGTKSVLPLLTTELGKLEDILVGGKSLTLLPRPNLDNDPRSRTLAVKQTGQDFLETEVREQLQRGVLLVDLTGEELDKRQIEISRTARTTEEETGARILFLALGFLEWFETEQSNRSLWAPLLLLPVELVRSPGREPFKLKIRDEDTRVNLTLLQKLKQDFRLDVDHLAELPEDDSGYDVPAILQSFRAAVLNMPRWQVHDRARLGLFSFNKLLMWQDLQDAPALIERNPKLKELLTGRLTGGSGAVAERELDELVPAPSCLCVLDSDSSQLSALQTADRGNSFVLQGPPGTGKSQTITNLIANTIAQGRSVLFVAEKLAALQVVHHRLEQAGLLPFCLELHSNKANKLQILQQLKDAQEVGRPSTEGRFRPSAEEVQELRRELNSYVESLHRPRDIGRSVFQATSRVSALGEVPAVRFPLPSRPSEEYLTKCQRQLGELASITATLGVPGQHLWRHSRLAQTGRQVFQDAEAALETAGQALAAVDLSVVQLDEQASREKLEQAVAVVRLLVAAPPVSKELLLAESWREAESRCAQWVEKGRQRQDAWAALDEEFTPALLELDLDRLLEQYRRWATVVILGWIMLWAPRKRLRKAARKALGAARKMASSLEKAIEVRQLDSYFEEQKPALERTLGWFWEGRATDWTRVETAVAFVRDYRHAVSEWGRPEWLQRPLAEETGTREKSFLAAWDELGNQVQRLEQLLQLDDWWTDFGALREWLKARQGRTAELRDWALYRQTRAEVDPSLEPVLAAHWDGKVTAPQLVTSFERSFLESWLEQAHAEDPVLSRFQGHRHHRRVEEFRERDAGLLALSRQQAFAQLAARVPDPDRDHGANSEAAILRKELKKQRRHKSPRRLFVEIKNLLPRLKPCIMMSPLSVAQYLDPSLPPFDLVVFDEASQVAPWDALGALARGQQWIVVGDSKQLPPSNFFGKTDQTDESFEDTDEELESILDECEGSGLRQQSLKWHYRSRHEELIVFSNRRYYENKLLTFPCNDTRRAVSFCHVEGRFDRGASRTNRAEAEAVVSALLARLEQGDTRSFGIVTFNQAQQGLIEDLLDVARREKPQLEPYFTSVVEPVFIKNLENVQGDERDVILFSVGYGPDSEGRFYMNFGPLNQQGGQRRLNVAVSRARHEMVVFSSMRSDDIDLSRSRARGVADLKGFLAFAERGVRTLDAEVTGTGEDFESPFEEAVGRALEARGWEIHKQVGCSGYKIDLAVVDPRQPGRYLMGIECDGASYHSGATARDRDRLRAAVLAGLGWQLERVWSTDWWHDAERELERLAE